MTPRTPSSVTPLAYERGAGETIPGVTRDGDKLVVCRGADISRVCLCCGRPTNGHRIVKRLHTNSSSGTGSYFGGGTGTAFDAILAVIYVFVFIFWIISLIAEVSESKKRTVTYGLCESHRNLRSWLGYGALSCLLGGIIAIIAGIVQVARFGPMTSDIAHFMGIAILIAGPLMLIAAGILTSRMPGVSLHNEANGCLWIKGAGKAVLDAQAMRPATNAKAKVKK